MNLDVTGFNTGCVTNAEHIFDDCKNLTNLDIRGLDIDWGVDIKERSVLMSDADYGKHVLGSDIQRESIHKIKFVKINISQVQDKAWDVSAGKNGMIWAWIEDNNGEKTLKIGAENRVYANSDSSCLFRTISGNPRQFNYRDESVGLCVSAQKYNNKNLFLISPDSCICFRKKAGQICVENQEHFVL